MASKMAQEIIYCDLCETTPAQIHCNLCIANLCKPCVGEHISTDPSKDHHVVIFKMRNIKPIFPSCTTHENQTCEMQCRQCKTPVCNKCLVSGSHKQHDFTELLELCNSKKEDLKETARELEKNIYPSYEKNISEVETQIQMLPEKYEKLITDISKQGEEWHKEVDIIINKRKAEAEKMKNQNLDTLKQHLAEMKTSLSMIQQAVLDIKELLKLNNFGKIMAYKSSESNFNYPPPKSTIKDLEFMPLPIQGEQLLKMFGTMTENFETKSPNPVVLPNLVASAVKKEKRSSLSSPCVVKTIDDYTGSNYLEGIACLKINEFWVMGNDQNIKHFNTDGLLQETVAILGHFNLPYGVTVTKEDDLIYTDSYGIHKVKNGKVQKIISKIEWCPGRICCTASGDLLVCMSKKNANGKVVRYSGSTEKHVIQYNEEGKPLFSSKLIFIDENLNGDICVSDKGAKRLVILNEAGKLRFHYSGNLSSQKYSTYDPHGVATDSLCQILTADNKNNCIHIIDCDGNFICYIDNCQLSDPHDISVDKNNTLYVAECDTCKVKVIKYLA